MAPGLGYTHYGTVSILCRFGEEPLPAGVEPFAGHLFKQVSKFAALTGLEVLEPPPVVLNE